MGKVERRMQVSNRLVKGRICGYVQIKIEDPVTLLILYNENTNDSASENTKKCQIKIYKNDLYKLFQENHLAFSIFRNYNVILELTDDEHVIIHEITDIT